MVNKGLKRPRKRRIKGAAALVLAMSLAIATVGTLTGSADAINDEAAQAQEFLQEGEGGTTVQTGAQGAAEGGEAAAPAEETPAEAPTEAPVETPAPAEEAPTPEAVETPAPVETETPTEAPAETPAAETPAPQETPAAEDTVTPEATGTPAADAQETPAPEGTAAPGEEEGVTATPTPEDEGKAAPDGEDAKDEGKDAKSEGEDTKDEKDGAKGADKGSGSKSGAVDPTKNIPDFYEDIVPTEQFSRQLLARTFKAAASSNEAYEINSFIAQFVSGAKENDNGDYVWTPGTSAAGHEFVYRVNFAISGDFEIPAGCIKITVPKSILKNRDGEYDDAFEMSLPTTDEYAGSGEFAYYVDGDSIVVTNMVSIPAGTNGYFEIAYLTADKTFEYADYGSENDKSDDFTAEIEIAVEGAESASAADSADGVYMDTKAEISGTQKSVPTRYDEWQSSWGEAPEDADDSYYLLWKITTQISGDTTQPYNFSLEDVVSDLTDGIDGVESGDYETVKLKMDGGSYVDYPSDDPADYTQYGLKKTGARTDYVVTRHSKSVYGGISYELKNTETATIDPADQVDEDMSMKASATYLWDPGWIPPVGHFYLDKYGNNNWPDFRGNKWDYANYELERFQPEYEGSDPIDELGGLAYCVRSRGYPYPWTLAEGATGEAPEDYGVNPVTYDTWDNELHLQGDDKVLSSGDYYFSQLYFYVENNDAYVKTNSNTGKTQFEKKAVTYAEDEVIDFYVQVSGGSEWIKCATYNLYSKSFTFTDSTYVNAAETVSGVRIGGKGYSAQARIVFNSEANVTGWRHVTTNAHYYTQVTTYPWAVLKDSAYVSGKVTGQDIIRLQNFAEINVTYAGDVKTGETIFEMDNTAYDYARVSKFLSSLDKTAVSGMNDTLKKQYTIGWKSQLYETVTGGAEGTTEFIYQNGGTFYDLLPGGASFDAGSVTVQANTSGSTYSISKSGKTLSSGEYDVETIDNYNGTGRTLLIVRITTPAYWYRVYYSTVHPWDSIADYGRTAENRIVYETGNESITGGVSGEGLKALDEDYSGFTRSENAYLYKEAATDINALTAAVSGLYKKVKAEGDADYSYETETTKYGTYSYKLRYQNTYLNSSKNLVLFDSLENYDQYSESPKSGWKGTLTAVDLSQMVEIGSAPVLYISTQENLDLEAYYASHSDSETGKVSFDPEVWTAVAAEDLADAEALGAARAVAIDMSQAADGGSFVLPAGSSVTATLYMQAPAKIENPENNYTYNNVYLADTLVDELGGESAFFIHQDYTKVRFRIVADVAAYKVSAEDKDTFIMGTEFRLSGVSDYGTVVEEYAKSNYNGRFIFRDIEAGTYELQEYSCSDDWQLSDEVRTVVIDEDGRVFIDGEEVTSGGVLVSDGETKYTIENEPRRHNNIYFYKKDLSDSEAVMAGVRFRLSGMSAYGNEVLMYAVSDSTGKVKFANVE